MGLGWTEIAFLGVLAVLVFGEELPTVARDAGRMFHQIKRSLSDIAR